jgi:hypothetical protein
VAGAVPDLRPENLKYPLILSVALD